jgi:Yip1 domain
MTDPMISTESAVTSAAPKAAAWEDLLDIFYAPSQVFERRKAGDYWVLLALICVLAIAVYFLSAQVIERIGEIEFARTAKERAIPADQIAMIKAATEKWSWLNMYIWPILVAFGAWISGLVVWLVGLMMGGKMNFAQGTTIALLATMPETLERILIGAQGMFLDTASIVHKFSFHIGAARFLPADTNKWVLKLAALADPFAIWGAVLLGIGAHVIGKMEKEKAAVLAIVVTLVMTLLFR